MTEEKKEQKELDSVTDYQADTEFNEEKLNKARNLLSSFDKYIVFEVLEKGIIIWKLNLRRKLLFPRSK